MGVWMVVLVDEEVGGLQGRKVKVAPPVDQAINGKTSYNSRTTAVNGRERRGSFDRVGHRSSETPSSRPSTRCSVGTGGGGASLESFAI